ncbi:hypothetical protein GCM10025762_35760 [Haloechinothrix salitolerans]
MRRRDDDRVDYLGVEQAANGTCEQRDASDLDQRFWHWRTKPLTPASGRDDRDDLQSIRLETWAGQVP